MDGQAITRRAVVQGGAALAGLAALGAPAGALAALAAPATGGYEVLPWLDQPAPVPAPVQGIVGQQLVWEELGSQLTPSEKFFTVAHNGPRVVPAAGWQLDITGLVDRPVSLDLAAIRALPRREITFTLECSGNTGLPFLTGAIGNATWAGTPLAPLLRAAGPRAPEVVFWGADSGPSPVGDPPAPVVEQFARSLSLADALDDTLLLCYEMNGAPLHPAHGFPVRLLAPGWYGIANVKWLRRIELLGTRYEGRFMGRDYVTQRKTTQDGLASVRFTSVGRALLKSAPARVVRGPAGYQVEGVAWGAPIGRVEARIDGGPWLPTFLVAGAAATGFEWQRWGCDWDRPTPGEHTVTSRAFDTNGNVQPPPDHPAIADKLTYWESNGQITRKVRIA
jgi:DMSO/TMAO reductase YedYZ molybdopterin-dependent catalytic subunit